MSNHHSQALRTQVIRKRRELSRNFIINASHVVAEKVAALASYHKAMSIAAYSAFNNEVNPFEILNSALLAEKRALLPVLADGNTLRFAPFVLDGPTKINHYGIHEPVCESEQLLTADNIDLLIIPLVCFDRNCNRIGMGGGYYDRTLSKVSEDGPIKIGIAYEMQRVESISVQPWDIAMDMVVTEQNIYSLAG